MKNAIANIKANKAVIIRRSIIVVVSVVAISVVAYVVKNAEIEEDDVIITVAEDGNSFTVSNPV